MPIKLDVYVTISETEYAQLKADAERYRFMRNNDMTSEYSDYITDAINDVVQTHLDETIDQARANV